MKKLLLVLGVLLLGYWMLTDPSALADLTKNGATNGWQLVTSLFNGVIDFVGALVS